MASDAFTQHLLILLQDADEILNVHGQLRTGRQGRQWGLGSLNRAVVVICVSAWEAYVERVIVEAITAMRPKETPLGSWSSLKAWVDGAVGRFNNPNFENVRALIFHSIGLPDISEFWFWRNCTVAHARELLTEALKFRHQIAHGVNPRPVIHSPYATQLPEFIRRLGRCTDAGIRQFLVDTLGIIDPWPP